VRHGGFRPCNLRFFSFFLNGRVDVFPGLYTLPSGRRKSSILSADSLFSMNAMLRKADSFPESQICLYAFQNALIPF